MKTFTLLFIVSTFLLTSALFAIESNQFDNFQDQTLQGWVTGAGNPNPPVVVPDGGPMGTGDAYLLLSSNGGGQAGSRLIVFNTEQWTGNYITAGISHISMYMNNFSSNTLEMRIVFEGPGGNFWSSNSFSLPAQSGWQIVQFHVQASDLTGGIDLNATLSNVSQFRIVHSVSGGNIGDKISATLGLDNITAAEFPLPVELTSFTAGLTGKTVTLNWATSSEVNNLGFEIERASYKNNNGEVKKWGTIGFKKGAGTTTEKKLYTFSDNISYIDDELVLYRLKQLDFDGSFKYSDEVMIENNQPVRFSLEQNYPNPFNPTTVISYQLAAGSQVTLKIYDVLGNEVATLVNELKPAGTYELLWNGKNNSGEELTSGIYFYRMETTSVIASRKMMLLR